MTTQGNGNNLMAQGRLVWCIGPNVFEGKQKTDYNTNAPVFGLDGNPTMEYGFGLAIPKVDPATGQATAEYQKVWQALNAEALTLFPSGQVPPGFAMKFKDGDGVDHNGKPYADKEGYAGHIILACTTQIPVKYFKFEGGNNVLVNVGIKVGDYVNVQLNVKAHPAKGQGKAGLYLNPSAVQLIQAGKEIINTPSGDQIFGQVQPAGYNGQVVADVAPTMPGMGQPQMAPQVAPTPVQPQVAPTPVQPNYEVLPPAHQPQVMAPQAAPAMPPMGGQPQMAPGVPAQPHLPQGNVFPANGIAPHHVVAMGNGAQGVVPNVQNPSLPATNGYAQTASPSSIPGMPPM